MAANFPSSPATNDTYTYNGTTWRYNGTAWLISNYATGSPLAGGTAGYLYAKRTNADYDNTFVRGPKIITTTVDFSSQYDRVVFSLTGISTTAQSATLNRMVGLRGRFDNGGGTRAYGTVSGVDVYAYGYTSGYQRNATIEMRPWFTMLAGTGGFTQGYNDYTAHDVVDTFIPTLFFGSGISGSYTGSWNIITNSAYVAHSETSYITKTVTGCSWIESDQFITCNVSTTSIDHTQEDASLEGVRFEISNIVPGTGFDINASAPEGTYGKYTITCFMH